MPSHFLSVRNVTINFGRAQAVRALSLGIAPGEVVAVVGESGSGKSVTALAIMGLLGPQARLSGEIIFGERDLLQLSGEEMRKIRGAEIAMIFQEPMTALNPVMRVGDQVAEAVLAHSGPGHRVGRQEAWRRALEALREVAIPDYERRARDYPHQLSGGQRQRVTIAMAVVNRPKLLIADEPTAALDVTIQAQILELLAQLRHKLQSAMLFISHDLAVVRQIADRVTVMYAGSLVEQGSAEQIFSSAAHPYTQGLLQALPTLTTDRTQPLRALEGSVPSPASPPPGCPFEPRCQSRIDTCARLYPPLVETDAGHWARCPVINPPAALL